MAKKDNDNQAGGEEPLATPDPAADTTAALQQRIVELTAQRDEVGQCNTKLKAENRELLARLAKLVKPEETLLTLPAQMRKVRGHGLPDPAGVGQIAKAAGMTLQETQMRLDAACAENPSLKQSEGYSIYGMTLWRYLGVEFVPGGS